MKICVFLLSFDKAKGNLPVHLGNPSLKLAAEAIGIFLAS
jgi:hypothetical protein